MDKISQGNYSGNNTVEGQESTSKKGQSEGALEESKPACSPLTLPGEQPERPGETQNQPSFLSSTNPNILSPTLVPSDTYIPQPIFEVIRPLTSSGLVSPPPSLPLVKLPNHPPLSPIQGSSQFISNQNSPDSPDLIRDQLGRLGVRLERSHIRNWLQNLSPCAEPQWDDYFNTPPTYNNQQAFWESRFEVTEENLLSPVSESQAGEVKKIQLVETLSSELDSESDLVTCMSKESATMPPEEKSSEEVRREELLKECERELKLSNQKLIFNTKPNVTFVGFCG